MLFLWNASSTSTNREIEIQFFDSSSGKFKKVTVGDYKPYFLTTYPLPKDKEERITNIQGEVELVRKRNLLTDELVQLAKVKTLTPILLKKLTTQFENVWENEIEHSRSYIYDNDLVFGAPYIQQGNKFVLVNDVQRELKQDFNKAFEQERQKDPLKYAQIEKWFNLCHGPVPEISIDLLGGQKNRRDVEEQIYLAFLLARIANIPVPEAHNSRRVSDWIKSMIYTHLRKNSVLIPTSRELRRGQKAHRVPGALTIEPKAGIYFNTVVCDYESLYPSCIDSYNLSYETIDCAHEKCKGNRISETKHHVCTKRKGFYSILIGALKDLRIRWFKHLASNVNIPEKKRRLANSASKLLKLISVSSFGVTVRIHGVACPPLAESITAYGRWVLQTTWEIVEKNSMHPTYGDTDSIFLDNPSPSQVQMLIKSIKKQLNLDLAIEKEYSICVLPKAKKAYFGITNDGTPDLKGLTAIKSNAPKFIQAAFRDCVRVLSNVGNMDQYVSAKKEIITVFHEAIKRLQERKVNLEDLVYSVQLYHDPRERVDISIMSQPYQCALQLMDDGETLNRRDTVHFVKVKPFNYKGRTFTVKPETHVRSLTEINVEDYIRNLTTALEQTFEPMGIRLDRNSKLTDWLGS